MTQPTPDLGTGSEVMGWMLHTAEEAGRGDPGLVWVSRSSSVQNHQRLAWTETHERTEVLERLDVV